MTLLLADPTDYHIGHMARIMAPGEVVLSPGLRPGELDEAMVLHVIILSRHEFG